MVFLKLVDAKAERASEIAKCPYLPANERHIAYTSRQPMRMQRAVPSVRSVCIFVTGLFTEARWLNSRITSI